ncbi:hypothetical protein SAMN05216480_105171 [Pustulibacterium marinum]|uniref:Uncharacterized protein n=1 Tax=Pustulibacterium marinum TaxID=1224947 RepID=A0A1I7GQB6_9FLAO|nr:hypothetical protein [Pustulibacterium marinum]SFU50640.1 hypothetical protein SAMN05216480_105171 [Pustulibacterium marinum]
MLLENLPKQPSLAKSYWNVGKLLYSALILFIIESVFYYGKVKDALEKDSYLIIGIWVWSLLFSFTHIFLVLADGWSRFQNYKRIKDLFFEHGFSYKLAAHYRGSKCQRMAVLTAAEELGIENEVKRYYKKLGIKWYHFIPSFMVVDPWFIFKKYFWSRTFLEKSYQSKFDYKKLNQRLHAQSI